MSSVSLRVTGREADVVALLAWLRLRLGAGAGRGPYDRNHQQVAYFTGVPMPLPPDTPPGTPLAIRLAGVDWAAYEKTCPPDLRLGGTGDLCRFLGGTWDDTGQATSFTGHLLRLISKGQSRPERLAALEQAFPRETFAWHVWRVCNPIPTARELCATLTDLTALGGDPE